MPTGFNAAEYLLSNGRPDAVAVVSPRRSLTYAGLAAEVRRVAAGLSRLGVRPEERVMLCMVDDVELLSGILGAMLAGAVAVPVSTMVTGLELGRMLADSRARVLCVSGEFAGAAVTALGLAPEVTDVVLDRADPGDFPAGVRTHPWSQVSTEDEFVESGRTWEDSPALWLYTSGTTGQPKGAMHRHASIRSVCETYARGVLAPGPHDRFLSVPKLFFAYGLGNSAFFPLSAGGTTLLEPARPTPALFATRAKAEQATLFFAVPTFYAALLASDVPDDSFASVRQAVSAGEPLPASLYERVRTRFGMEVLDGIGSTEALHIFLSNRPGAVRPGSTGVPVPGYAVQLRDEAGAVIDVPGRPGELYVSGPSTATGYWARYEATKHVFQGEWLRTGDSYVRNEDGTYSCLGRFGDMLKAGGMWVSPSEVEERLRQHPAVAEVAVVAAPDADGLEKPVACVVAAPGQVVDAGELIEFCRAGLAAFKRPRAVVELAELPKTATGKIRRNVLREHVHDALLPVTP